ncbi:UNVERIFIED_CONTAM: Arf GTPase arf1, partial [Siphonaria sp. JEL0065]
MPTIPSLRILMLGLDAAGKTSILYRIKLGELVTTIPTIGFNVEEISYKDTEMILWDLGGCDKIRPLWRHYMPGSNAVICVIDSTDKERLPEALRDLQWLVSETIEMNRSSFGGILVYANKQDRPNAMHVREITHQLMPILQPLKVRWAIMGCSATAGTGLFEGLEFLVDVRKGMTAKSIQGWIDTITAVQKALLGTSGQPQPVDTSANIKTPPPPRGTTEGIPGQSDLESKIRASYDYPPDPTVFLDNFGLGNVAPFDHRAHLRIGYLILLQAKRDGLDNSVAVALFLQKLKNFFRDAGSKVRNTYH